MPIALASTATCPLCGDAGGQRETLRGKVWLKRCNRCSLVFAETFEVPPALYEDAFTAVDHPYHGYADEASKVASRRYHTAWAWRRFFKRVEPTPGDQLLDIGCSTGVFLAAARDRGWQVSGVELSASAASVASDLLGCQVWTGTVASVPITPGSLAAVTAWEVLEHVPQPLAFLRRVYELLAPGGWAAISTPNWESRWERATNDAHRMPPFHLTYWTPRTLTDLFERCGFIDVSTARKPFAWTEEVGARARTYLPVALFRSYVLGQKGNRLFGIARRPR